mmetsp:Transcript_51675/g.167856  ORF Transcript_51675/g.167856 Transcript_51675/m.167856 type:complete len:256 (-) Transcript_51675:1761-2528(-)
MHEDEDVAAAPLRHRGVRGARPLGRWRLGERPPHVLPRCAVLLPTRSVVGVGGAPATVGTDQARVPLLEQHVVRALRHGDAEVLHKVLPNAAVTGIGAALGVTGGGCAGGGTAAPANGGHACVHRPRGLLRLRTDLTHGERHPEGVLSPMSLLVPPPLAAQALATRRGGRPDGEAELVRPSLGHLRGHEAQVLGEQLRRGQGRRRRRLGRRGDGRRRRLEGRAGEGARRGGAFWRDPKRGLWRPRSGDRRAWSTC